MSVYEEIERKTWWGLDYYMGYWLIIHVDSAQHSQSLSHKERPLTSVIYE